MRHATRKQIPCRTHALIFYLCRAYVYIIYQCFTYVLVLFEGWRSHSTRMNTLCRAYAVGMYECCTYVFDMYECCTYVFGIYECCTYRTKSFLESSGCRTRPLKTRGYQPRLTQMGENHKVLQFQLMVQIKQKGVWGVENLLPRSFLGGVFVTYKCCTYSSWISVAHMY